MADVILHELAAVVDRLNAAGDIWGWGGGEIAEVALRRWRSFGRRSKSTSPNRDQKINDLRKGLQAHSEPDIPYTPDSDWRRLAGVLLDVLEP